MRFSEDSSCNIFIKKHTTQPFSETGCLQTKTHPVVILKILEAIAGKIHNKYTGRRKRHLIKAHRNNISKSKKISRQIIRNEDARNIKGQDPNKTV
jgi:hypothetical protein